MVIEFNHQLFLKSNLFYGFRKYRTIHDIFLVCLFFCVQIVESRMRANTQDMRQVWEREAQNSVGIETLGYLWKGEGWGRGTRGKQDGHNRNF